MCTFKDQQHVLVCDVAIGQVRASLTAVFGEAIRYTSVEGQGTLVQAPPSVAGEPFLALTRAAIDQAQQNQEHRAAGLESVAGEVIPNDP